ncbi:hypothetical protein [Streptomyces mexicanus]|jgi:hypothetical protein|uniref:Uncharacterized protein n=1 Tax=Streptomyces mexicanus TaxID=178566 RepID=A0A7X1I6R1_9ACTN|nr:hypothetical protein [Streptomyces mexicanus]MBC2868743.1 hypothetical protein [Streptomyces mexicanus]
MSTTPASVAARVAEILGGDWTAGAGSWETYGRLDAPDSDTYTLYVDDHDELCLSANLDPTGEIASFRRVDTPEGIEALAATIAAAIRQHHTAADQE